MKVAIIIALMMLILIGGGIFAILFFIKKTDPKNKDTSEAQNIKTAQEFLPFEDIADDMILLGNHRYRAVLTCSSTNYELKTPGEREQIELAFQRFLNSVSWPITFFLQTKVIDNTARLEALESGLTKTIATFPNIEAYAEQYLEDMRHLNERLQNSQQKRRYVVVTYDNVDELNELTEDEKAVHAAKELRLRCQQLQTNLNDVGVKSRMLSTGELVELVYSTYYRDDYSYAAAISDEDAFALIVKGEKNGFENMPGAKLLGVILGETISQIQLSNVDADPAGRDVLAQIKELREKYALDADEKGAGEYA